MLKLPPNALPSYLYRGVILLMPRSVPSEMYLVTMKMKIPLT